MKLLLDDQLSERVAKALAALLADGHDVAHVRDYVSRGLTDDEIPTLCKREGVGTLITMNVKDFGAKKHYYAALLENDINVVVLRPGKGQPDAGRQLALISQHLEFVLRRLSAADNPVLIRVTISGAVEKDLDELVQEITGLP